MNFYLPVIQMVVQYSDHHLNTSPVFKWCSQCQTKFSPVFKWHSNNGSFGDRTTFDHLNTRLVRYSDPHCIITLTSQLNESHFLFRQNRSSSYHLSPNRLSRNQKLKTAKTLRQQKSAPPNEHRKRKWPSYKMKKSFHQKEFDSK